MSKHAGRPQGSPLLMAGIGLALAFTLSCTSDIETAEDVLAQLGKSSSSAEPSGTVFCMFPNGVCSGPIALDACNFLDGNIVQSCGTASSSPSSAAVPLSSSVVVTPSSSSAVPSSSSALPSSSSVVVTPSSSSSSSVPVVSNCSVGFTVTIGTQTWMKNNLNCDVSGSKCYNNQASNCDMYGRLYDWSTAMTVCPSGWHLPSQAEWNTLSSYVQSNSGCSSCDARLLKATSGWNSYNGVSGNGTDAYSFSALPGGNGSSGGSFYGVGNSGNWWSSDEYSASGAYGRYMYYYDEGAYWYYDDKSGLFSVRCVKD